MHTTVCKFHTDDHYTHKCMPTNTKKLSFIAELVSCFASISEGLYVSKLKPAPAANKQAGGDRNWEAVPGIRMARGE